MILWFFPFSDKLLRSDKVNKCTAKVFNSVMYPQQDLNDIQEKSTSH